jgi:Bacterial Ig-like domain/WD40-like Beta Propeller Repeat
VTKRAVPLRTVAVLAIGVAALGTILYYASTVDARGPTVVEISLTQHLSGDAEQAVTTTSIEVAFSEPVEHASAQAAFAISPQVSGAFSWSATDLTFTPAERLPLRTAFEVSIGPGVRDRAGNEMTTRPGTFEFTTVGNPVVLDSDPADGATDVALDAPIVVDFSTLMDTASVERAMHISPDLDVSLRWSREKLTVAPSAPLAPNRRYSVTIGIEARDQAGTPLERPFNLSFRTVASGLSAKTIVPADGVSGIAVTTPIAILFDRALDPDSVRGDLLSITPALAGSLDVVAAPGAADSGDAERRILRFEPSGPLDPNTTYEVTLAPGLLGADGAGLPGGLTWSFTTGAPTATLSNQVVFLSDRAGISNLWAMNPDGSNQRQLSSELSPVIDYAVSPDGRTFITANGAALVWQRADGSARRLLTDPGDVEFDPAYSPDGTVITFGRADPAIGTSLGLWMRDADGSDPRRIDLPSDSLASPLPSASGPTRVPLLRAPRMSPDGTALAFVDEAGWVAILDLEVEQLTLVPFDALSEPIWLADGSGVLVSGLPAGSRAGQALYPPHMLVPPLDPATSPLDEAQASALRVVRIDRFATSATPTAFRAGAARVVTDGNGRYAFIRLAGADRLGGSLVVTDGVDDPGGELNYHFGQRIAFASFTPEAGNVVFSWVREAGRDGVMLYTLSSGANKQLSPDGWLPRWLP